MPTADPSRSTRRDFVLTSAGLTAAGWAALSSQASEAVATEGPLFQAMFDTAIKSALPEHWAEDGVHPSLFGHPLMAHTWLGAVGG